jgi:dolichol-phosphate mannosyltransferase
LYTIVILAPVNRELELAVVVPTFDEHDNILELLGRLDAVLTGIAYEVIVVDDDSPDGTAAAVQNVARVDPRIRVLRRVGRRGLSSACIEGMMSTPAPYVAVMDADLQHDERILPSMLAKLKAEQLDVVVASRHREGGSSSSGLSPLRQRLSDAGKSLSRFASKSEVTDPMSGFFLADRRFVDETVRSLSGRGFKILLDLLASSKRPARVGEVPYHFRERLHGESKLDLLVGIEYLHLLADKLFGDLVPPRFVLFGLVGGSGVILHLIVLYAMLAAGLTFAVAQITATVLVMTSNFFLNNIVTWRDHRLRGWALIPGLLKFYLACSIGALLNLEVATSALQFGLPWYAAGFAGLMVGSVWNFAVTYVMTWRRHRSAARRSASA